MIAEKKITWSGFENKYSEQQVKATVRNVPGVYLLWVKLKNGNWRCFYVGKTDDLRRRFLEHLSDDEPNQCLKKMVGGYICGFEYAIVSGKSDRSGIEKFLYDHYSPECNQVDPGGQPIEINLP